MTASIRFAWVVGSTIALMFSADRARADVTAPSPTPVPILGGDLVEPCGFPTTVSVGGFCTGTLVHPRVVVYAAHCGDEVPWIRFSDRIEGSPGFDVVPEACGTHPIGEYGFGTDAAFCRLVEPVMDVPIIPPLMGCEAEAALKVGQAVTVVGFGNSDDEMDPYGVKRFLDTQINALSWDEVFVGGSDEGVCYGDSGGPTYVKLDDGAWRSFGITSWGQPGCGFGGYLSTIPHNIEWIEQAAGVDITPCHDGVGTWDPNPECGAFDDDPHAEGGDWGTGCDFGPLSGWQDTCGPAFDPDLVDASAPVLTIVTPLAWSRIDPPEGASVADVPVAVEIDDGDGWGVGAIELVILQGDAEQLRIADPAAPFTFDNLEFPIGVWTLRAEGIDRAGNPGVSDPVVFGVGEDPPEPPPPPDDTTGGGSEGPEPEPEPMSSSDGGSDDDGDGGTTGDPQAVPAADSGCGCRSDAPGRGIAWLVLLIGLLARRRAALGVLTLVACGDDPVPSASTDSDASSSTTSMMPVPGSSSTGDDDVVDDDTSDPAPDVGAPLRPGCGDGIVEDAEICDDANLVDGDGCSAACLPSGEVLEQALWPERRANSGAGGLARAPDGSYVAVGYQSVDPGSSAAVVGVSAELATTWSTLVPGDAAADHVFADAVAIDPTGTIYAAGYAASEDHSGESTQPWLARFDPDGTLVWSVVVPAETTTASYRDLVVLPDGDPVAVGAVLYKDTGYRRHVQAHHADDGSSKWSVTGSSDEGTNYALSAAATSDGEVLVAGWNQVTAGRDLWLGRFAADGELVDTTIFGEPITYYYPRAVAMTDEGDAIVCGGVVRASAENAMIGRFTLGADSPAQWLQRIEPQGQGASGCNALAIDTDGRIAITGFTFHADGSFEYLVGRLSGDGDILWSEGVAGMRGFWYDFAEGIAIDDVGDLVVAGTTQTAIVSERLWLGRIRG